MIRLDWRSMRVVVFAALAPAAVLATNLALAQVPDKLNYQGRLTDAASQPVNATVPMVFKLYSVASGGSALYSEAQSVTVSNGIFSVAIGSVTPLALPFDVPYYIGVSVGADPEMTPRQALLAAAYAQRADMANTLAATASVGGGQINGSISVATLPATQIVGTIGTAQIANNAVTQGKLSPASGGTAGKVLGTDGTNLVWQSAGAGTVTSVGTGAGLSGGPITASGTINLAATQLLPTVACAANQVPKWNGSAWACSADNSGPANAYVQGGNAFGVLPGGTAVIGTTDNTALDVRTNGARVVRYEANAVSPNVIGGSPANNVTAGVRGAFIGGGGVAAGSTDPDFGFEAPNVITDAYGTVAGGYANRAGDNAGTTIDSPFVTVGGGAFNTAAASYATVSGGGANQALGPYAFAGGGEGNLAQFSHGTVAGGGGNTAMSDFSTVGGGDTNTAGTSQVVGVASTVAGGSHNIASANRSTVGGGDQNKATGISGTVAGGASNQAAGIESTVGGGSSNFASGTHATIGGGHSNQTTNTGATVAGGVSNYASGINATVGGGLSNTANGIYSTIPGGSQNVTSNNYAFAAGFRAKALAGGCFTWADANDFDFNCAIFNAFTARATGGVYFVTAIDGVGNATAGVQLPAGSGAWSALSDRAAKRDLALVDGRAVLAKLAQMPVYTWRYKSEQSGALHLGPVAQDFATAFGLGDGDKTISTVDADGVAIAAIQGLNARLDDERDAMLRRLTEKEARIEAQHREIDQLTNRLSQVEALRGELAALRQALAEIQHERATIAVSAE
ncbi:MAG TPA: tail fiber domain-containing protein [Casimicrobiaceae bacterium]|nr:tail fiber domain-containing protein [Casimicrobiaceae bacterium]